jgi:PadR family transcriptional regulator PadR
VHRARSPCDVDRSGGDDSRQLTNSQENDAMGGSDLFVGTLDVLILKAVSQGRMHGYAIGRWIRQTTNDALTVQEGALYPALHRLERKGLLEEDWGVSETGREAKYYKITATGRRRLRSEAARWKEYADAVALALAVGNT